MTRLFLYTIAAVLIAVCATVQAQQPGMNLVWTCDDPDQEIRLVDDPSCTKCPQVYEHLIALSGTVFGQPGTTFSLRSSAGGVTVTPKSPKLDCGDWEKVGDTDVCRRPENPHIVAAHVHTNKFSITFPKGRGTFTLTPVVNNKPTTPLKFSHGTQCFSNAPK